MASDAICTAVWNPNVKSVAARSLSIVLGTPTTDTPNPPRCAATPRVSSPPIAMRASMWFRSRVSSARCDAVVGLQRVRTGRAEDRPAAVDQPARARDRELHRLVVDDASPAVAEPDDLVAVDPFALAHDGADDRVEPRTIAAAGEHSDPHPYILPGNPRELAYIHVNGSGPGDRRRHDERADRRRERAGAPDRLRGAGVHAALPATGLGRARSGRDLVGDARDAHRGGGHAPGRSASPRSGSPTNARPWSRGTASPACRATVRSCGRTGAPRAGATHCATRATNRSCASRTGLVLDPYFSATKVEWLLGEGGVDGRSGAGDRHRRHVVALESHRRR